MLINTSILINTQLFTGVIKKKASINTYGRELKRGVKQQNQYSQFISNLTVFSCGLTRLVLDARHLNVVLRCVRLTWGSSNRFTTTCVSVFSPMYCGAGVPSISHITVGAGRPDGEIILCRNGKHRIVESRLR